jgi:hypothetical protein
MTMTLQKLLILIATVMFAVAALLILLTTGDMGEHPRVVWLLMLFGLASFSGGHLS